jgi:hypothetical protein
MPRFTLKELLLATTLIATGAGIWAFLSRGRAIGVDTVMVWIAGGAFIGAGIFTPFKQPWAGAIVAIVLQFLLLAAVSIYYLR